MRSLYFSHHLNLNFYLQFVQKTLTLMLPRSLVPAALNILTLPKIPLIYQSMNAAAIKALQETLGKLLHVKVMMKFPSRKFVDNLVQIIKFSSFLTVHCFEKQNLKKEKRKQKKKPKKQ